MNRMSRDVQLETLLRETAREVEFPPTPPLAQWVRRRVDVGPIPVGTIHLPRTNPSLWRPVPAAAAVVAVVLAFTLTFSVTARKAVADLLGVVGINITFGDAPEDADELPGPQLSGLDLGERVSRAKAESVVGFEVRGPMALKGPSRLFLDRSVGDSGMVSTVFYAPSNPRRALYLITEFKASVDEAYLKKVAVSDGNVRYVSLHGVTGFWLTGKPHVFGYVDETGAFREETVRLAGNVLLWETDGITYRVEGASNLKQALKIAARLP